jgi:ethanolamine transporter EutH
VFIIFAFMLSGILLGSCLRYVLPEHHTQADSKDILMTASGMMATLVALIIGLLVSSANNSFDITNAGITQEGAKVITLDYYLSRYGSEAKGEWKLLRQALVSGIERIWPNESS